MFSFYVVEGFFFWFICVLGGNTPFYRNWVFCSNSGLTVPQRTVMCMFTSEVQPYRWSYLCHVCTLASNTAAFMVKCPSTPLQPVHGDSL